MNLMETIFEKSQSGQHAYTLSKEESVWQQYLPEPTFERQSPLRLPEISEIDLTRHFIGLSRRNMGIDTAFYPLGSCTMKLNPRINETIASFSGFTRTHPLAPDQEVQGNLAVIDQLLRFLMQLTGMAGGTLTPNAGAQGELTGVKLIAAYHRHRNDLERDEFLVPDSAHGTNPATVSMASFCVRVVKTGPNGDVDLDDLKAAVSRKTAGLMLTNPNTLGLFSPQILEISKIVHDAGGLLYYDGANLNPILTIAKPQEMGFDVMHINLHKTFSTPHGGGGPGSGPVLCTERLIPFLPLPYVIKNTHGYHSTWQNGESIGQVATFYGNFAIFLRAFVYVKIHGLYGLRRIAELSVLNANYLKTKLAPLFTVPFPQPCMHEFVVQADRFLNLGVKAQDIAKRLLDYGIHAPTVYFPLIIKECFLIEPTESESKRTLDQFVAVLEKIIAEINANPEFVKGAPYTTHVRRLNETVAAKQPILVDPLIL